MFNRLSKTVSFLVVFFVMAGILSSVAYSADLKVGYVDLRRAFYEYKQTKVLEAELKDLTDQRQGKREKMIKNLTDMRDKVELLRGDAKIKKQNEMDAKLAELQEFDRTARQELLTKKNDMFRGIIEKIQKVVEDMGAKGNYDYVIDSRNIMYAQKSYDMTDSVIKQLNKRR